VAQKELVFRFEKYTDKISIKKHFFNTFPLQSLLIHSMNHIICY